MGKKLYPPFCVRAIVLMLLAMFTATMWADNVDYFDPTAADPEQQMKQANATLITDESFTLDGGDSDDGRWYYVGKNTEISAKPNPPKPI